VVVAGARFEIEFWGRGKTTYPPPYHVCRLEPDLYAAVPARSWSFNTSRGTQHKAQENIVFGKPNTGSFRLHEHSRFVAESIPAPVRPEVTLYYLLVLRT
jgi:hypothetical protein